MAEQEEVKKEEVIVEKKEETKVPEHSEMEHRALGMGWRPKEEWKGEEDDFIDAKEFVRRKPLFDRIDSTGQRLKKVEEALNQLASHHQQVKEVEYQRALKELRLEKRSALKEGDTTTALELEDKMDELTEQRQQEVAEVKTQKSDGPSSDFVVWVKDNDWYLKDEEMHDFADGAANSYLHREKAKGHSLTEEMVFRHVLEKVKKAYPEKFENPNRQKASAVSSGDRSGKPAKSTYTLSEEEEAVAKNFEKQGIMTRDEYIKERKSIQGAA